MKSNQARVLAAASLLLCLPLWLRAEDSSAMQAAQMESVKRQQLVFSANQAVTDGQRLLISAKYDDAAERFQYAVDALTSGGVSEQLYNQAASGLAAAKAGQSRMLAKDGKFAQAAVKLQEAINLQPDNPIYRQDLENLKKQQMAYEAEVRNPEGVKFNPAVTDEFKDKVAAVQKLLFQGDAYFKTGQYEKAEDTYSKILILDPYNKAARNKMSYIEGYRSRAAGFRHEEYEQDAFLKVNQRWSEAISPDIVVPPKSGPTVTIASGRAAITRKLQSIIIDKVNFDKLDIATVIQFLTQKTKELDPDHVGINFVLRLTSDNPAPETPTPAPGGRPAPPGAPAATPPPPPIHREVSITLENVPLADVLNYIVEQTNLQFTVEDYAVYLRPSIDEGETLTVRTFLAPPNLFQGSALRVTTGAATADNNSPTTVESVSSDVQQALVDRGIRFPAGATATFLPGSSKLVVRNTAEQLDLIANLIDQLSKETPEVQIEAKIAEFTQDALKALSFNYTIGAPGVTSSSFSNFVGGAKTALRNSSYTSSPDPNAGLTAGSVNALIQQNGGVSHTSPITGTTLQPNTPNFLQVGAIIDGTGMQAVVQAINNTLGASLLSAPSVTTQSGLQASIEIVREFPYPTNFEKPKLSSSQVAYTSGPGSGENFPLTIGIPPTPREFFTQDIGVKLEVKPTIYSDQRIDLDITKASVTDFDGFIDYGLPIVELPQGTVDGEPPAVVLSPGTINQPVFNIRSVVTRLQVLDGQTAVLGGLIREDTQEINDKVPVLGDLPLLGRLFQSKVSERTKKNLIFFVTARLVRSNGKPQYIKTLNAEVEEDKLSEPQLGPGITLPPLPEGGGS